MWDKNYKIYSTTNIDTGLQRLASDCRTLSSIPGVSPSIAVATESLAMKSTSE